MIFIVETSQIIVKINKTELTISDFEIVGSKTGCLNCKVGKVLTRITVIQLNKLIEAYLWLIHQKSR